MKKKLIEQILISPSPFSIFEENFSELRDTRFLLFDNNSNNFGKNLKKWTLITLQFLH
ncbi:hypothetical protein G8850_000413 [Listeria monocytogenes]|nr:hypothetical protein [Listeria monocytogenes]